MFNFFIKKDAVLNTINIVKGDKIKTYPKAVQEIHNEFFTAGDSIILEAKLLISNLYQQDLEKGKRLWAMGFGNTKEAITAKEAENKLINSESLLDLVMYFKQLYPNNKFITETQVAVICEKYGLVCGEIFMYKGFVPSNKLDVIEEFKLHPLDMNVVELVNTCVTNISIGFYRESDLNGFNRYILSPDMHPADTSFLKEIKNKALALGVKEDHIYIQRKQQKLQMRICAPLKDMDLPSDKMVVRYKIQEIPDPIVLQPVCGGYLIVAAWGDEASDPIVVNEKMN